MNPDRIAQSQLNHFARLLARVQKHVRTDSHLPTRIQELLARNRSFGSRDRKLYRELLYTAVRYWPWCETLQKGSADSVIPALVWLAADTPATQKLRAVALAGWPPLPPASAEKARVLSARTGAELSARDLLPGWFHAHGPALFDPAQLDAQLARAPLWIRLQTDAPALVFTELARRGIQYQHASALTAAVKVISEIDLTLTDAYRNGLIEIQDLGSQLILETVSPAPGGRWLDVCAGAGGKTLQLARCVGPRGSVEATDIRAEALRELARRVQRAGLDNVRVLPAKAVPAGSYDGVLVDAPCSGSGTWRRSPHLKWLTTPEDIATAARQQQAILAAQVPRVRSGGLLVYATCSLSRRENQDVVRGFLTAHPEFAVAPPAKNFGFIPEETGLTIWPAAYNTDGFFVSALRRVR
jgi:16S rRNA (cytosine967-C5)-methyltransferase